jgi:peptide deformylase
VSVLDIRVLGDPILRLDTKPVAAVTDDLRQLIDDMFETMRAAQGIGLAAPQVGRTERITVVHVAESGIGPLALVNPEIVSREGSAKGEEGCLSIPDIFGDVERATAIVVRALDRNGAAIEVSARDLLARCLQHEIDHLHGKLFIDHLSVLKRRAALAQWSELKPKFPGYIRHLADETSSNHHREEL